MSRVSTMGMLELCLSLFVAFHMGDVADAQIDDIIRKHEAYLDSIQTLHCFLLEQSVPDGGDPAARYYEGEVLRDGDKERLLECFLGAYGRDGKWTKITSFSDRFYDGRHWLVLANYDRSHPPREPLTIANRFSGVRGSIEGAKSNGEAGGYAWDRLLFSANPSRTVLGIQRDATKSRIIFSNERTTSLEMSHESSKAVYYFEFDASKNYMMTKRRVTTVGDNPGQTRSNEVIEFEEPKPGLFVPKLVRALTTSGGPVFLTTVSYKSVNDALDPSLMAFRFPDGLPVVNHEGGANQTFEVYENNQPAERFANYPELRDWLMRHKEVPGARSWLIIGNAVFLASFIAVALVRRALRRRAAKAQPN